MRSMKPCSIMNVGAERTTATTEIASMTTTTAASSCPMTTSMLAESVIETTHTMGTGATMVTVMSTACCTTFTSESVRVIMLAVPKVANSLVLMSSERANTAMRMSRPMSAASREATQ